MTSYRSDCLFLGLLFTRASVPPALELLLAGRSSSAQSVAAAVTNPATSALVQLVGGALTGLLLVAALARVVTHLHVPPGRIAGTWLFVGLAVVVNSSTVFNDSVSPWRALPILVAGSVALVPVGAAAVVRCVTSWLAWLAAASVAVGILLPNVGLFEDSSRWHLLAGRLAGIDSHPNSLGLLLALGMPILIWQSLERHLARTWCVVAAFALIATSSRTALAAAMLGTTATLLATRRAAPRKPLIRQLSLAAIAVVAVSPVWGNIPSWFRGDGRIDIWAFARSQWRSRALIGHGSDAWKNFVVNRSLYLDFAFHAHNLWLDLLIVGGVIALSLGALWALVLCRASLQPNMPYQEAMFGFAVAFLVSSMSEVPIQVAAIDGRFALLLAISCLTQSPSGTDTEPSRAGPTFREMHAWRSA